MKLADLLLMVTLIGGGCQPTVNETVVGHHQVAALETTDQLSLLVLMDDTLSTTSVWANMNNASGSLAIDLVTSGRTWGARFASTYLDRGKPTWLGSELQDEKDGLALEGMVNDAITAKLVEREVLEPTPRDTLQAILSTSEWRLTDEGHLAVLIVTARDDYSTSDGAELALDLRQAPHGASIVLLSPQEGPHCTGEYETARDGHRQTVDGLPAYAAAHYNVCELGQFVDAFQDVVEAAGSQNSVDITLDYLPIPDTLQVFGERDGTRTLLPARQWELDDLELIVGAPLFMYEGVHINYERVVGE